MYMKKISNKTMDMSKPFTSIHQWIICLIVLLLSVLGLILTCSAEVNNPYIEGYNVSGQLMVIVLGMLALAVCSHVKMDVIQKAAPIIGIVAMVLLFLLCTPLGLTANGATRWLKLGYITIRPEEVVVFAVILVMAYMTAHFHEHGNKHQLLGWTWGAATVMALSVSTITNNLVYPVLILGITYVITLVFAEMAAFHIMFLVTGIAGITGTILFALKNTGVDSFRLTRLRAWLNPEQYADTLGYQAIKQLEAIKTGGWFGKGFGNGELPLAYRGAYQDGLFAFVCEEFGWIAAVLLIAVLVILFYQIYKILRIAIELRLSFAAALTLGVLAHLGLCSFIHIARNLNLLPNGSGIFPFVSHTGLSGIFCFCEIGLVLAVAKTCNKKLEEKRIHLT